MKKLQFVKYKLEIQGADVFQSDTMAVYAKRDKPDEINYLQLHNKSEAVHPSIIYRFIDLRV